MLILFLLTELCAVAGALSSWSLPGQAQTVKHLPAMRETQV